MVKSTYFDENVEIWSFDKEEVQIPNSQNIYLNSNPKLVDLMLPVVVFPPGVMKKLHEPWQNCFIIKLLGKSISYKALTNIITSFLH